MKPTYCVYHAISVPEPRSWQSNFWESFPHLNIDQFHGASTNHRPGVTATVIHTERMLHIYFEVHDCYVRATQTSYQSMVCEDSCVEAFIRPKPELGYFNFELNCCGVLHCSYITDWTRVEGGFCEWTPVPPELGQKVVVQADLKGPIRNEITDPLTWHAVISIPLSLFEHYVGKLGCLGDQQWTANFYKCADKTSHPHWAAWSPIKQLNFHDPDSFGCLTFQ